MVRPIDVDEGLDVFVCEVWLCRELCQQGLGTVRQAIAARPHGAEPAPLQPGTTLTHEGIECLACLGPLCAADLGICPREAAQQRDHVRVTTVDQGVVRLVRVGEKAAVAACFAVRIGIVEVGRI